MDYSSCVDTLAWVGKCAVEGSSLNPNDKEWAKLGIEGLQNFLKAMQPIHTSQMSVMGFTLEQIAYIKNGARHYGLKRVLLFPINVNGEVHSFFRMYEGNIDAFCAYLGITRAPYNVLTANQTQIDELINKYGVIVYDRE